MKVTFDELLKAYGFDDSGKLQNGLDPLVYVDKDDNIVLLDVFTLEGMYNHRVEADDELKLIHDESGDCDYWNVFGEDVDVNIYSADNGYVAVSFYPVVDGKVDTTDTRLEGIRCDVQYIIA
jgi:hypothetical protein